MLNAWDFVFGLAAGLAAWLGWRLKSLPILGLGFVVALAPWLAELGRESLGSWLEGPSLRPGASDRMAWWLLWAASAGLLMLLFLGLSKMLAALRLEFLDRGFGAAICLGIFFSILSLNLGGLKDRAQGEARRALVKSWSWKHLRITKKAAWIESIEEQAWKLKLPQKP
jgi:hypothetical protein